MGVSAAAEVLRLEGLGRRYGEKVAVDRISFSVGHGEVVGLLGPNGAGKTTTIDMILGVLEPSAGSIQVEGLDVATQRREALERTNFAAVYAPLPGNLSVFQNLRIFGLLYGVRDLSERISALLAEFEVGAFRDVKCGILSSGEQTRVGLAKAMLNRPRLLLLDEPTASLDPATARISRKRVEEALRESQQQMADIITFLPEAIMAIDLNGKVMIWNHAMEVLTGVLAKDILGKGNYEYSLPFYGYRRPILVDMVLEPPEGWEAEYLGFKREGTAVIGEVFIPTFGPHGSYLLAKATALCDEIGNTVGAIE